MYIINREYKWIHKEVYIEVIIKNDSQKLRLDVLKSVKYDAILEMPWLHKKNLQINWINKELYATERTHMMFLNNWKRAYQSISLEIMRYHY